MIRIEILACILFVSELNAQIDSKLYMISNPAPSVFNFVEYDIPSATITTLDPLPISSIFSSSSSTIDEINEIFYFCTGTSLYILDPNGVDLPMNIQLPLDPAQYFIHMVYDACSGKFYGLLNSAGDTYFAEYDLTANEITSFSALSDQIFSGGPAAFIDAALGIYVLKNPTMLLRFDLGSGSELPPVPIAQIPNESFDHIAFHCSSRNIYGTSAHLDQQVKFLSELDDGTGEVSHVSDLFTENGFWKPMGGGSTIDQQEEIYYWSGAGGQILGADLSTGAIVHTGSPSAGELYYIQHFSSCDCSASGIVLQEFEAVSISPNPFNDHLRISMTGAVNKHLLFVLCDQAGRVMMNYSFYDKSVVIDVNRLDHGIYFFELTALDGSGDLARGKIIKQ